MSLSTAVAISQKTLSKGFVVALATSMEKKGDSHSGSSDHAVEHNSWDNDGSSGFHAG